MHMFYKCCSADCPGRTAECHVTCKQYIDAKQRHDEEKKAIREANLGRREANTLRSASIERYRRRCGRK